MPRFASPLLFLGALAATADAFLAPSSMVLATRASQPVSTFARLRSAKPGSLKMVASPNPIVEVLSAGMGLIKPIFMAEAKLQGSVLGGLTGVSVEDAAAEINQAKANNKVLIYTYTLSPFSTEALSLLESTGYEFTKEELGLEWFALGGMGSQKRVAMGEMVENGATSLPKIFIGGQPLGGASGYSALAEAAKDGSLEELLSASGAAKNA